MPPASAIPAESPRVPVGRAIWPVALAVTVFFASGQSDLAAPELVWIPSPDKVLHFCVYGLLATLVVRVFFGRGRSWQAGLAAVLLVSGYGIADEFRQSFTPGRAVELADWVADTLGAMVAVAAYCLLPAWRRMWETPLRGWKPGGRGSIVVTEMTAGTGEPVPDVQTEA